MAVPNNSPGTGLQPRSRPARSASPAPASPGQSGFPPRTTACPGVGSGIESLTRAFAALFFASPAPPAQSLNEGHLFPADEPRTEPVPGAGFVPNTPVGEQKSIVGPPLRMGRPLVSFRGGTLD